MTRAQEVDYIRIKNKINFEYINKCYDAIDKYEIDDCAVIYEMFRGTFQEEIKKYKGTSVKNLKDIYSLDNSNKIIIKNFIKHKLRQSINHILVPLINTGLSSSHDIRIPGCFTIILDKEILVGSTRHRLYSTDTIPNGFLNITLLRKFILVDL